MWWWSLCSSRCRMVTNRSDRRHSHFAFSTPRQETFHPHQSTEEWELFCSETHSARNAGSQGPCSETQQALKQMQPSLKEHGLIGMNVCTVGIELCTRSFGRLHRSTVKLQKRRTPALAKASLQIHVPCKRHQPNSDKRGGQNCTNV